LVDVPVVKADTPASEKDGKSKTASAR